MLCRCISVLVRTWYECMIRSLVSYLFSETEINLISDWLCVSSQTINNLLFAVIKWISFDTEKSRQECKYMES